MENWKTINGYEHYEVSNLGQVRRCVETSRAPCKILKGTLTTAGYPTVGLWAVGATKKKTFYIHHLVAQYFLPPKPIGKYEIAHCDGNEGDPAASNLRWATKSENETDKIGHKTSNRGERHGMSKLTKEQVIAIREMTGTQTEIASVFGVAREHVRDIRNGKRWGWL